MFPSVDNRVKPGPKIVIHKHWNDQMRSVDESGQLHFGVKKQKIWDLSAVFWSWLKVAM